MPGEPGLWRFLVSLYKSIGLAALLLIIILMGLAFTGKRPGLPADTPLWQVNLTHSVHALPYMMMLNMLSMGVAASAATASEFEFFGLFIVPNVIDEHKTVATVIYWVHFITGLALAGAIAFHAEQRCITISTKGMTFCAACCSADLPGRQLLNPLSKG